MTYWAQHEDEEDQMFGVALASIECDQFDCTFFEVGDGFEPLIGVIGHTPMAAPENAPNIPHALQRKRLASR